jgi:hypothetical protein
MTTVSSRSAPLKLLTVIEQACCFSLMLSHEKVRWKCTVSCFSELTVHENILVVDYRAEAVHLITPQILQASPPIQVSLARFAV